MSDDSSKPDPFDPKSLRIDPSREQGSGVEKVLLHVPVRKPHRQEFFRTHPSFDYRERSLYWSSGRSGKLTS